MSDSQNIVFPKQLAVPATMAAGLVIAVVTGYMWLDGQFDDMGVKLTSGLQEVKDELDADLDELTSESQLLRTDVETLKAQADTAWKDRYTATMAERDALRRALANPDHWEPDPANPGEFLRVGNPAEGFYADDGGSP